MLRGILRQVNWALENPDAGELFLPLRPALPGPAQAL